MKNYLKYIIDTLLIVLLLGLYAFIYYTFYYKEFNNDEVIITEVKPLNEVTKESTSDITVEIKGAVASPDVYKVPKGSIIKDLVTTSGGFLENAYTDNINLSKKLEDHMVIYVFTKEDYQKENTIIKEKIIYLEKECNCENYDISSCKDNNESVIKEGPNTYNDDNSSKVNINTASIDVLTTLSGIGESKAKAIISYRELNGNFQTIEDIMKVSGISENIYDKIKDSITI